MGIKGLTKLINEHATTAVKEVKLESYMGRKVAIDASQSIYQFMIVVGRSGQDQLTNEEGEVTSHLQGMFHRTIRVMDAGIKPVYVFDGRPPELKSAELAKRGEKREGAEEDLKKAVEEQNAENVEKYSKRTVRVTRQHNEECRRLLTLMGVPVIEAPSEAEAQCASLCQLGKVFSVASEDMDTLTFNSPLMSRDMLAPASQEKPILEFDIAKVLACLGLTMDQFIDLCILMGCDYCGTIGKVGPVTALKLIQKHGNIETVLQHLDKNKHAVPDPWPYQEARKLFKEPAVLPADHPQVQADFKWGVPDEEGIVQFLVGEKNFSEERVRNGIKKLKAARGKGNQGRMESFFGPPTTHSSTMGKRKEPEPTAKGAKQGKGKEPAKGKGKGGATGKGKVGGATKAKK